MLDVNGRISRDASHVDTTWLEKPELNVGNVFNWQISGRRGSVDWNHVQLSEEGSCEFNESERKVLLIGRSSKSECKYWLVVRLKAIEYKENFLYYLSSIASLSHSSWMPTSSLCHFPRLSVIWSTYNQAHSYDGYLIGSSSRVLYFIPYWTI